MSTYGQGTRKYFRKNFDVDETANIKPGESFPVYGI